MAPDQIRTELSRILASSVFEDADRAKTFLRFIVTTTLDGHGKEIKESVIAVEALGRSTSFDPKADPIVRVEAGRLRQRLKAYYDSEGLRDTVLITLPKGTYVPEFSERKRLDYSDVGSGRHAWARPLLAGLLTGLILAGIGFRTFQSGHRVYEVVQLSMIPPPGSTIESSRVSPDGRMIAFTSFQQNRTMLWVRSLDSPEPRLIPGTETATQVFWSLDSRSIAFFRTDRLLRVEVAGGPPQEICPVTIPLGGGTWGRNSTIVFSPRPEGVLYKVPATGGVPQPATVLDKGRVESIHRFPEFLPDGKHFLYVANSENRQPTALRIGSIDSSDSKVLLEDAGNAAYVPPLLGKPASLFFYFHGMVMAQPFDPKHGELTGGRVALVPQVFYRHGRADFSVSEDGTLIYRPANRKDRQLAWYDRTGRLIAQVGDPNDYRGLRLSPDDQHIVFTDEEPDWTEGVWVMDLATRRISRVTNLSHTCFYPVWSPDGSEIVYANGNEQGMKLLRQSITSAAPVTILDTPGPKFPTDWSADGRFVTYFTPWPEFVRLKAVLLDVQNASHRILLESHYNEAEAVFCPSKTGPRWFAYTSTETGRPEVYVRSFPDVNHKLMISNGGGWQPVWRRDGGELFYLSPDGIIMAVEVRTGKDFSADRRTRCSGRTYVPTPAAPSFP